MTELVFVLDRSGSMSGLASDTIGGFNSMIEKQRQEPGETLVTTVLFDDRCEVIHDRVPLEKVPALTEKEYFARGCTALLDAVGGTVRHIAKIHKYARPEDRPGKTMFVITTDGMENASRRYGYERVREMIRHEEEKYGWEFLFLGADIDVAAEAGRLGIRAERAASYRKSTAGVGRAYSLVADMACNIRAGKAFDEETFRKFAEDQENK